jgi:hypothetical protein
MVNGDVVGVEWATPVWLSGSGSGVGGRGWVFSVKTPISLLNLFISLQRKQNKSGVLLVFDFLAPALRVNFSLAGKQSLVSATTELKLFPLKLLRKLYLLHLIFHYFCNYTLKL